jgi:hypothetical protein
MNDHRNAGEPACKKIMRNQNAVCGDGAKGTADAEHDNIFDQLLRRKNDRLWFAVHEYVLFFQNDILRRTGSIMPHPQAFFLLIQFLIVFGSRVCAA